MRRGDHQAAWAIAEEILRARDPATRDDPTLPYHRRWVWDGTPLRGQDILVRCYHGLGDTLQFARFLPALRAQASRVTLEVQPELASLLATIAGPDRIVPFSPGAPTPPSPCDIEIMELAQALRLPPDAAPVPYLHAPPIPAPPGAIGLCWQAGNWDEARSIPTHALAPIIAHLPPALQPAPKPIAAGLSQSGRLSGGHCPDRAPALRPRFDRHRGQHDRPSRRRARPPYLAIVAPRRRLAMDGCHSAFALVSIDARLPPG